MNNSHCIQPGSTVSWTSSSNGTTSEKVGTVIGEIPKGRSPVKLHGFLSEISSTQCKLGNGIEGSSLHPRYLVRVDRTHRVTGEALVPFFYAPRANVLSVKEDIPTLASDAPNIQS